jgi:hypothetical protein
LWRNQSKACCRAMADSSAGCCAVPPLVPSLLGAKSVFEPPNAPLLELQRVAQCGNCGGVKPGELVMEGPQPFVEGVQAISYCGQPRVDGCEDGVVAPN